MTARATHFHSIAARAAELARARPDGTLQLSLEAVKELRGSLSARAERQELGWAIASLINLAALAEERGDVFLCEQLIAIACGSNGALGLLNATNHREAHDSDKTTALTGRAPIRRRATPGTHPSGKPAWSLDTLAAMPRRA